MADSSVAITAGSGTPIRVLTGLGTASADQQVVTLADSAGNLLGTATAGMPVASGYLEVSGSTSTGNGDAIAATDAAGYRWVSIQLTGTWTGTVTFQGSNDNSNWVSILLSRPDASADPSATATGNGVWAGNLSTRYLRVRFTTATSGTVAALAGFSINPGWPPAASMKINPLSNFGTSDAAALGYAYGVTALSYVWNGSTFDRWRSASSAKNTTGLGVPLVAAAGFDGTNYQAAKCDTSGNVGVLVTPPTAGGWSVSSQTALTNTKVAVKASAGSFGGYIIYNPNTTAAYVQVFDVASASVTLGTTTPTYTIPLPALSTANIEMMAGIPHATAITVAATTTATGSTAPTTALTATLLYK